MSGGRVVVDAGSLRRLLADEELAGIVEGDLEEAARLYAAILSRLGGELGVEVEEVVWDPFEGWLYRPAGGGWRRLPRRLHRLADELFDEYNARTRRLYRFKLALQELLAVKHGAGYTCRHEAREKRFICERWGGDAQEG